MAEEGADEGGGFWLEQRTEEFERVAYMLRLSLGGRTVGDLGVWKVDNPHATVSFERRTSGMLTVDCFVDAGELDELNSLVDVCRRGFVFLGGRGRVFSTGRIQLDDSNESFGPEKALRKQQSTQQQAQPNQQHHLYLLTEVGIGRPFIADDPAELNIDLPKGYDSVYVPTQALDRNKDGVFSLEEYQAAASFDNRDPTQYKHNYYIHDTTRVLPKYVVRFFADVDDDADPAQDVNDPMQMYDRFDFFDPILFEPVSLRDKMIGTHSSGEAAAHKLISIAEAYQHAIAESERDDPVLIQKKNAIIHQLQIVDDKLREVNMNYAEVEERIYDKLKAALKQLQDLTRKKMEMLLATELELRREMEEIEWSELHIANMKKTQGKVGFLRTWKWHTDFRTRVCRFSANELEVLSTIVPDLHMLGDVMVVEEGSDDETQFYRRITSAAAALIGHNVPSIGDAVAGGPRGQRGGDGGLSPDGDDLRSPISRVTSFDGDGGGGPGDGPNGEDPHRLSRVGGTGSADFGSKQSVLRQGLTADASAGAHGMTALTSDDLMTPAAEAMLMQASKEIQRAVHDAAPTGPPLPPSLAKPLVGGGMYPSPLPVAEPEFQREAALAGDFGGAATDTWNNYLRRDMKLNAALERHTSRQAGGHTDSMRFNMPLGIMDAASAAAPSEAPEADHGSYYPQAGQSQQQPQRGMRGGHAKSTRTGMDKGHAATDQWGGGATESRAPSFHQAGSSRGLQPAGSSRTAASAAMDRQRSMKSMSSDRQARDSFVSPNDDEALRGLRSVDTIKPTQRARVSGAQYQSAPGFRPPSELHSLAEHFGQFSLSKLAQRKKRQLGITVSQEDIFGGTSIMSTVEAETLYFCLPFISTAPRTELLYATAADERHVDGILDVLERVSRPTVLLCRAGGFIFGGYCPEGWRGDEEWHGNPRCFLFSITLDIKIPYHGRQSNNIPHGVHSAMLAGQGFLQFGAGDLRLTGDLRACSSELENSYGIGLNPGGDDAKSFLAGAQNFMVDDVEVWLIR